MIPVEILDVSVPLESTNSVVADDANEFQARPYSYVSIRG
jgi:hypothetical protein